MPAFAISLPSGIEWLVILAIVMILFGVGRLPQVFEAVGKGIKNFKDAQREDPVDVTPRAKELGAKADLPEAHEIKEPR